MKQKEWVTAWPVVFFILVLAILPTWSATFEVNTTTDSQDTNPGDGVAEDKDGYTSLRAAIMEANALADESEINLPAGLFILTIPGHENQCEAGDLDILKNITINGAGMEQTIINANSLDRCFHILGFHTVEIKNLTIRNGKSPDGRDGREAMAGEDGGGILNRQSDCSLYYVKLLNNTCGNGSLLNSTGRRKRGGCGGGIANSGEMRLNDCVIMSNRGGGGSTGGHGGGIYNTGKIHMFSSRVVGNHAGPGGGNGGGIYSYEGSLSIYDSEISYNEAGPGGSGGGIYFGPQRDSYTNTYKSYICDCTISHNSSTQNGGAFYGGGICNLNCMWVRHCTIAHNVLKGNHGYGGGIYNYHSMYLFSTIVAGSQTTKISRGPDLFGSYYFGGYNLVGNQKGFYHYGNIHTNFIGVNPKLGGLAFNGGNTRTHDLLPGSPAIDSGPEDPWINTDQRNVRRPKDGDHDGTSRTDIGALEAVLPRARITSHMHGQTISGSIRIEAKTNMQKCEFFIDDVWTDIDTHSPFSFYWNTTYATNGTHKVTIKGFDTDDIFATDSIMLNVRNVELKLKGNRFSVNGWLIHNTVVRLTVTVSDTAAATVAEYLIYRQPGNGWFSKIGKFYPGDLVDNSYTFEDLDIYKNLDYTYHIQAIDGNNQCVGRSEKITL